MLSAKIVRPDFFGKMKIAFSERISIKGINISHINSSNTDIRIIPFKDQTTSEIINLTKYNLTWNVT